MPSGIVLAQALLQVRRVAQAANTTITVSPGLDPGHFLRHGGEVGGGCAIADLDVARLVHR